MKTMESVYGKIMDVINENIIPTAKIIFCLRDLFGSLKHCIFYRENLTPRFTSWRREQNGRPKAEN
jgi:hypothetical protein